MAQQSNGAGRARVFVYGTLKRGQPNHYLLDHGGAEFLGEAVVGDGLVMLDLGFYPGVIDSPNGGGGSVTGEVYAVDVDTLHSLDILEGHPSFYERVKVTTPFKSAWIYKLPASYMDEADVIESGVWVGRG